jgi:hypothetical protein
MIARGGSARATHGLFAARDSARCSDMQVDAHAASSPI